MRTDSAGAQLMHDCYYEEDVLAASLRFEDSEEWKATHSIVSGMDTPHVTAMDLGAGNGIASYALARLGFRVLAVEPDPSPLIGHGAICKLATQTGLPIMVSSGLGEHLPYHSGSVDLVYARQVLHHASDLSAMLWEIARILRPGGVLLACREHVVDDKASLAKFLERHPLHWLTGTEGAFTLAEYLSAIETAGLRIRSVLYPWDSPINYYPLTSRQLHSRISKAAQARYGPIGRALAYLPAWRKRYIKKKNQGDRTPGRMFTFVAVKR